MAMDPINHVCVYTYRGDLCVCTYSLHKYSVHICIYRTYQFSICIYIAPCNCPGKTPKSKANGEKIGALNLANRAGANIYNLTFDGFMIYIFLVYLSQVCSWFGLGLEGLNLSIAFRMPCPSSSAWEAAIVCFLPKTWRGLWICFQA